MADHGLSEHMADKQICLFQGLDIKDHMRGIPQNSEPAPIIRIYVDLNLQTLQKAGVISAPLPDAGLAAAIGSQDATQAPANPNADTAGSGSSSAAAAQQPTLSTVQLPEVVQPVQQSVQAQGTNGSTAAASASHTSPASSNGSLISPGTQVIVD